MTSKQNLPEFFLGKWSNIYLQYFNNTIEWSTDEVSFILPSSAEPNFSLASARLAKISFFAESTPQPHPWKYNLSHNNLTGRYYGYQTHSLDTFKL